MYNLEGINGNAYSVIGYVTNCMKKENKTEDEIRTYQDDAMSGDSTNLLCVSADMVELLNDTN